MITAEELNEIKTRWEFSTPGPWKAIIEGRDQTSGSHFILTGEDNFRGEDLEIYAGKIEDYDFIANAKQDIPKLIDEIQRLKNIIADMS
jgi:hypothetical protein